MDISWWELGVLAYTLNRLFWLIPTIFAMSLITFLVMHATPGSPLDPVSDTANPLSPDAQRALAAKYGLDQPLHVQYLRFVWNALHGDWGKSYIYKTRDVTEILQETFPISLHLGTMALLLATVAGLTLGVLAAVNQNSWIDYAATFLATLCISLPNFVMAVLLILVFALIFPIFPTGGWEGPHTWVLPTITLALGPTAIITRYTRSSMIDAIRSDYVRTAWAKGLSGRRVVLGHVLKNALIPVVTIIGPLFAAVGTGSFFVEAVYRVPGMGQFFVRSMAGRDYSMIMAVILLYGAFLSVMNLIVDLTYGAIDPRIRFEGGSD